MDSIRRCAGELREAFLLMLFFMREAIPMKHLFIVNPVAGGHDSTELVSARVAQAFSGREEDFEIYTTRAPMDAADVLNFFSPIPASSTDAFAFPASSPHMESSFPAAAKARLTCSMVMRTAGEKG